MSDRAALIMLVVATSLVWIACLAAALDAIWRARA